MVDNIDQHDDKYYLQYDHIYHILDIVVSTIITKKIIEIFKEIFTPRSKFPLLFN